MFDPPTGDANMRFPARVVGSGFEAGAQVFLGESRVPDVAFEGDNAISLTVPALAAGTYDVEVMNPDGSTARLRAGLTLGADSAVECSQAIIYFDLDSSDLSDDARGALTEQLDCWSAAQGTLRVEGHTDERGTTDYNLGLGERRAEIVRRFLLERGMSPTRVNAVSYGEEQPAETGQSEEAWAGNRRAVISLSR
jgi:outer membrane protein OmpA-like peptidoglycan-associated protein